MTASRDWLSEIKTAFDNYLYILDDDRIAVDCIYAAFLAGTLKGMEDKPWLWVSGPAGSSKTETVRPLEGHESAIFRDDLTSNAFMSGDALPADLKGTAKDEDPSLAKELQDKTLICKDYASIRARSEQDVISFMSHLRSAYDGTVSKHSGKAGVGLREYKVRFGLVLVTTPLPERLRQQFQQIGERLFTYRFLRGSVSEEATRCIIKRAIVNSVHAAELREALRDLTHRNTSEAIEWGNQHYQDFSLTDNDVDWLTDLSSLACKIRTAPGEEAGTYGEIGTRLGRQLRQLVAAHALFSGRTTPCEQDRQVALRLCYDSIPHTLLSVFNYMLHTALTTSAFISMERIEEAMKMRADRLVPILQQYVHEGVLGQCGTGSGYRLTESCIESVVATRFITQASNPSLKRLQPTADARYPRRYYDNEA